MSHRSRKRISVTPGGTAVNAFEPSVSGSVGREIGGRPQALSAGMTIGGRYRVERKVAAGSMGEVWQATHSELRLRVAIKVLRREVTSNTEIVARFSREAFLLARIHSDHVVRVIDFLADRRLGPVLVTEFVEGQSLAAILASRHFTVEEAIDLAIDVLSGLRELHRAHIIHRDVKPANVLVHPLGDGQQRAVFVDLGISRLVPETEPTDGGLTEITTADRAVGTIEYMAPEQVLSSRNVTAAADLYAVGAILYRAVAGHHAFAELHGVDLLKCKLHEPAPVLRTGRDDRVAKGFEELVARALATSPADRYEVADEMLADLYLLRDAARRAARTAQSRPTRPVVASPSKAVAPRPERRRLASAVVSVVAALAVGLIVGAVGVGARPWMSRRAVPSIERLESGSDQCSVTPAATSDGSGRRAFTIVCDAPEDRRP